MLKKLKLKAIEKISAKANRLGADYTKVFFIFLLEVIFKSIDLFLRILFLLCPLGIYLFFLQSMDKPRKASAVSTHLFDSSTYMFVAPGVILTCVDGYWLKKSKQQYKKYMDKNFEKYFTFLRCVVYICIIISSLVFLVSSLV